MFTADLSNESSTAFTNRAELLTSTLVPIDTKIGIHFLHNHDSDLIQKRISYQQP
ncbi:hypothetical protein LDENG_00091410 [Lucifuga dentata]|nr:hypothetical protein LDENG_00091410 [Lucifuga dentata]